MEGVGTMSRIEHHFHSQEQLIDMLSRAIATDLKHAIKTKGEASLIVSGGSTPKPLFKLLSQMDIGWENISVGLCDERWVEPTHEASNEHFVKTHLLIDKAKKANFIGMYHKDIAIKEAEALCHDTIHASLYPFDVVILGMGSDGHTASLFPHNSALEKGFNLDNPSLCISMKPIRAPHWRMSLTLQAILSATRLYLHFEGELKQRVYQEAIACEDNSKMPIGAILNQEQKDVEVYYQ